MGYYFEFEINCTLRRDAPKKVIDTIFFEIYSVYLDNYPDEFDKMVPHALKEIYIKKVCESTTDYSDNFWKIKRAKDVFSWYSGRNYPIIQPTWRDWSKFKADPNNYNPFWEITLRGDLNFGYDAINGFVEYITPYLAGHKPKQYIGWYKGENQNQRIELYALRNNDTRTIH